MLITDGGKVIRLAVKGVRITGRNAQGVHMVRLEGGERVRAVAGMAERDEDDVNGSNGNGNGSGDDSEE
jgi:DNA gyrase subunit A